MALDWFRLTIVVIKVIHADPGTCRVPRPEGSQDQAKIAIRNDITEIVCQTIVPALRCGLGECQSNPALSLLQSGPGE